MHPGNSSLCDDHSVVHDRTESSKKLHTAIRRQRASFLFERVAKVSGWHRLVLTTWLIKDNRRAMCAVSHQSKRRHGLSNHQWRKFEAAVLSNIHDRTASSKECRQQRSFIGSVGHHHIGMSLLGHRSFQKLGSSAAAARDECTYDQSSNTNLALCFQKRRRRVRVSLLLSLKLSSCRFTFVLWIRG